MSFPHFDGSISSVKDGRTKVRSILLLWSLKFYDKKYFSLGIEKQCLNKVSFENILSAYMFSPDAALPPSSETQGQSVGSGEKAARKFSSRGERAPGYPLSPNYFQTFKLMPAPDWAQKMICIIVPNRRTVSPEFFSWVRTWLLLPRSRLVWIMHHRDARSQETFSLM